MLPDEANRLEIFINKTKRNEGFSDAEINEYRQLVEVAQKEQSNNPDVFPLIALGAFLLGLWLGSQKK